MPVHIHAEPGAVAPVVLLPGDPNRARRIAALLDDATRYSENRGLIGFTGSYTGRPVSVQTTGMGAPTAAIVVEELIMLGARVLIRTGTAGGATAAVRAGDLVVATGSVPLDGTTRAYLRGDPYAPVPDFGVTAALIAACRDAGAPHHIGLIATGDALYAESEGSTALWAERGVLAFEMEASAIFTVATLRRVRAGCVVLVTNVSGVHDRIEGPGYDLAEATMLRVAVEAAAALAADA
jgi:purine-nucleoside phosphorylase